MKTRIVLISLIATLLLPGIVSAQIDPPPRPDIIPDEGTANIVVAKLFADDNLEDTATVSITCSAGTISPDSAELGHNEGQVFVLDNIPQGVQTTCTVTEEDVAGYTAEYLCGPPGAAGASGDCLHTGTTACQFDDVQPYEGNGTEQSVGFCIVQNSPDPVDVDVIKVWEMAGAAQSDVDTDVKITLFCDAEIVGGTRLERNLWRKSKKITEYLDEDGLYDGIGATTFKVIPEWYRTRPNPDNQEYTECWADENVKESAVEVDNDCFNIQLAVGMGDSCTITNTVFFEGIPTLSQYGMAIMALLMLGVGFVGMRRFV